MAGPQRITHPLKPSLLIPPVIALAAGSIWVGSQRKSISTLEIEIERLTRHIEQAENLASAEAAKGADPAKTANGQKPINWNEAAKTMQRMHDGGVPDIKAMMRFQTRIMEMDADSLVAAIMEIRALDLPADARASLESMVFGPLVSKDPKLAFDTLSETTDLHNDQMRWQLSHALGEWAGDDPIAAAAWLDEQIASGKLDPKSLDGKSQIRLQFESELIEHLITSDMSAASDRINALPEDQRADVLRRLNAQNIKPENQEEFATLVRNSLPDDEQTRVLTNMASNIAGQGKLENVDTYLDNISATPEERKACVVEAAGESVLRQTWNKQVTGEQIDTMRDWLASHEPDAVDRVTGETLGNAINRGEKTTYEDAEKLVLEYHQSSGSDDLLVGFLDNWQVRQNKEQALALADKISDQEQREKAIQQINDQ